MKIKFLALAIITILPFVLMINNSGANDPISKRLSTTYTDDSNQLYAKEILELAKWIEYQQKVHDSGDYYIFNNAVFKDLYLNPKLHFKYGMKFILDPQASSHAKQIVVKTLQCLPLTDYLALGKRIIKINDVALSTTYLSPGPEYGFIIDKNNKNKEVKVQLLDFRDKQPKLATTIELIMSGSNINRYEELKAFGEKLPVLECP